jgi:hypothetical protein
MVCGQGSGWWWSEAPHPGPPLKGRELDCGSEAAMTVGVFVQVQGNLTDIVNGIGLNNCVKAKVRHNQVSSTASQPWSGFDYLISGFRIAASPGSEICGNLASETGGYPNTGVPMEIGDPLSFWGIAIRVYLS